jgi:tetratricopeptide (TPR) repeat protein
MLTLLALGRYEEAIRESDLLTEGRRKDRPDLPESTSYKGYALARMGRMADAEKVLLEVRERMPHGRASNEALVLHALGRDDEALHRLQDAVNERALGVTFLGVYPFWDDLRDNAGFRHVLSQVNLLEVSDRVRK